MKLLSLFAFSILTLQVHSQSINDNLLIHYPLNNDVTDASGNGYDGTPNGVIYGLDRFGNANAACYFDGIDDYIDFPNLSELKPVLPVSFSFWIKYDGSQAEERVVFNTSLMEENNSGVHFTTQSSTGKYAVGYGDGSNSYSSSTRRTYVSNSVIDNSWHHIAIVINSELDMKIYVDCIESGGDYSGTGGTLQYAPNPGTLGRHDQDVTLPAYHFRGLIDDFRYWDRALVSSDIDTLCNNILSVQNLNANEVLDLNIYPNPSDKIINVQTDRTDISNVLMYDLAGKFISSYTFSTKIDVSSIESGIYVLNFVDSQSNLLLTRRVVVE